MQVTLRVGEPRVSDADKCRANGWNVGTRIVGDEGYGPTVIEITAIGEKKIIAKEISRNGVAIDHGEGNWTLQWRDWKEIGEATSGER